MSGLQGGHPRGLSTYSSVRGTWGTYSKAPPPPPVASDGSVGWGQKTCMWVQIGIPLVQEGTQAPAFLTAPK